MALTKPDNTARARHLRKSDTAAEQRLWEALRARRLAGLKYVRQLPIGPYYADFARLEVAARSIARASHSHVSPYPAAVK
jgi:very-short-patch-repair endonuclease